MDKTAPSFWIHHVVCCCTSAELKGFQIVHAAPNEKTDKESVWAGYIHVSFMLAQHTYMIVGTQKSIRWLLLELLIANFSILAEKQQLQKQWS